MTQLSKTFVCEEHQEYGSLGWREIGKCYFQPLAGMAVAHDCLEHFPDDGSAIEHEIQALGASLHVRGPHPSNGYRASPWWENVQMDLFTVFNLYAFQNTPFHKPPLTRKIPNEEGEYQISKLLASLPGFLQENGYESDDEEGRQLLQTFVSYLRGWLRIGYRRAVKRYRKESPYLQPLFYTIQRRADESLKHAEVGEQFVVSVNMRTLHVTTKHQTLDDLYPYSEDT